uniref:uncharacterized protein LOC118144483 n=1 Tax=Callithrix jacchus TaxID=9483 RepID=UPI0023DD57AD|nr:uncharacterized protein LOC118144483 [Callithrix jacchus]
MARVCAQVERRSRSAAAQERKGRAPPGSRLRCPAVPTPSPAPIVLPRVGLRWGTFGGPLQGKPERFSGNPGRFSGNPHTHLLGRNVPLLLGNFPDFQHPEQQQRRPDNNAVHPPGALVQSPASCSPAWAFSHPPGAASRRPSLGRRNLRGQGAPSPKPGEGVSPDNDILLSLPGDVQSRHRLFNFTAHFLVRTYKKSQRKPTWVCLPVERSGEECFEAKSLNSTEMAERDRHKRNSNLIQGF